MPPPASHSIHFAWLIRLRWAAIVAQVMTVLVAERLMHVPLPLAAMGGIAWWLYRRYLEAEEPGVARSGL